MCISLCQKLHLTRFRQSLKAFKYLGRIKLELLHGHTGDGESDLELLLVLMDQLQHQFIGRQVTLLCHFPENGFIGVIIVIVMIISNIKKTVPSEPERLVDLEIQTDGSHMVTLRFTEQIPDISNGLFSRNSPTSCR